MPDTTCVYTTLKNVSGAARTFSYLQTHGKTLAIGESITVFGDITSHFFTKGGRLDNRKRAAFESDLLNNRLEIIKSPVSFYYDASLGNVKVTNVDNGSVGIANPCYGAYTGDA